MSDVENILGVPIDWDEIREKLKNKDSIVCGEQLKVDDKPPNMMDIIWEEKEYKVPYFFVNAVTTNARKRGIGFFMNMNDAGNHLCFGKK